MIKTIKCCICGKKHKRGNYHCSAEFLKKDNSRNVYIEKHQQLQEQIEEDREYGDRLAEADYFNNYFEEDY